MNLDISNLTFNYKNQKPLFKDLNYCFASGQINWIRGPSGCGKSTFLKLVADLLEIQSGEIKYSEPSAKIAYVHQECHLIDHWSVFENLYLPPLIDQSKNKATIEREIGQWLNQFDLSGSMKQIVSQLSGGERQRISLIRALMQKPDLLLLDEPTAHLDDLHTHKALQILKSELHGKLVILVSHDQRVAEIATKTWNWAT